MHEQPGGATRGEVPGDRTIGSCANGRTR